jgi:hypothetical protein
VIQTLPFHFLHKINDPAQANRALPELIQKVNRQHSIPWQTPSCRAWLADMKAYRYENIGVPMKGAYVIMPKLRPRLGRPQIEETMEGKTVKVVP